MKTPARLSLAHLPTPVEPWHAGLDDLHLFVKRDDLTGSALSGNKIRKLEFLLAEAQAQGADTVITCGGLQSNHARATALAAAGLGMGSVLFLRGQPEPVPDGNVLLDVLAGARLIYITREQYSQQRNQLMAEEAERLKTQGRRAYVVPEGGSNALGAWGYVEAVRELKAQRGQPDYLVCATGSGGTQAGLIIGCRLHWPGTQVVGVNVCDDEAYFKASIGRILHDWQTRWDPLGLTEEDVVLADGYVGRGYALNTPEELKLLVETVRSSGLVLDPVYTLKALAGLRGEAAKHRFGRNQEVIFFHTGGIFGLFPKRDELAAVAT